MYEAGFFTPSQAPLMSEEELVRSQSICRAHLVTQMTAIPTFLYSISILRVAIFILGQTMIQNWAIGSPRRIPPFFPWTHSNQRDVFVSVIGGTDEIYLIDLMQKLWQSSVGICSPDFLAHPTWNGSSLSLESQSDSHKVFLFLPLSTIFPQKLKIFAVIQSSSFRPSSRTSPVHTEDNVP